MAAPTVARSRSTAWPERSRWPSRARPSSTPGSTFRATRRSTPSKARLRRWFDLDADVGAIGRHLARDQRLAPLVAAQAGLRVPGAWDPFELAIRAIVGQQISVAGARTIAGRLVARYGDRLPDGRRRGRRAIPATRAAGSGRPERDRHARRAGRAIVGFAAAVAADPSLLDPSPDLDAIVARLKALPGIGEWTAQYIALRGLKHPDAFPASDLGILRALAGPDGRRPTPAEALGPRRVVAPVPRLRRATPLVRGARW